MLTELFLFCVRSLMHVSVLCVLPPRSLQMVIFFAVVFQAVSASPLSSHPFSGRPFLVLLPCVLMFLEMGFWCIHRPSWGHIFLSQAMAFEFSKAAVDSSSWPCKSSCPTASLVWESFFWPRIFSHLWVMLFVLFVQCWSVDVCVRFGAALPGGIAMVESGKE